MVTEEILQAIPMYMYRFCASKQSLSFDDFRLLVTFVELRAAPPRVKNLKKANEKLSDGLETLAIDSTRE